ncbi:aspartyl protease family protein [Sphingomonas sp. ASV193]|uniref:aspartyl protease family protein n=1 Tax=Sphingomonas sp. ASV193 TaxID=3144405 RepID=UPI0032E927C6
MSSRTLLALLLPLPVVVASGALAAPLNAGPSTAQLLREARMAAGSGADHPRPLTLEAVGRIAEAGLDGAYQRIVDMHSGRFTERSRFVIYTRGTTFDGRVRYRIDPSGGIHPLDGAFGLSVGRTDGWLARRAYLLADAGGATFGPVAERSDGGPRFAVVTATPPAGQPVELWFDREKHWLAKIVRRGALETDITRFGDYRRVDGQWLPFTISQSSDASADVTRIALIAYRWKRATPATFEPPTTPQDYDLDAATPVPAGFGAFVTVDAELNGKGPFRFIIDTGGHNIITPAVAAALGIKPVGGSQSGGAGAGTLAQQDAIIDTMQLGRAVLRHQHVYVIPLQYSTVEQGAAPPLSGILGLELFERFAARFDYRAGKFFLLPRARRENCEGTAIRLRFDDDMPLVDGAIEGHPGVIAIDSGNSGSPVVQGVWAKRVGLAPRLKQGIETTSFGAGGASTNWITRHGNLRLGPLIARDVDLRLANDSKGSFASITEAANVGQQVLARYNVTFDYAAGRMCMAPVPGYVTPPLNRSGVIAVKSAPGSFSVASVARGSDAERQGIRAGDEIVEIDGIRADRLAGKDFFDLVRQAPGTTIRLRLARQRMTYERTLTLRDP